MSRRARPGSDADPPADVRPASLRIDKWLWHARFFKTRGLAAKIVAGGGVRVNRTKINRPGHVVRVGDTLTIRQARAVRVVTVLGLGDRRGPASEAALLYEEQVEEEASPPPRRLPAALDA